jgi:excisionase family DNA binding protein
MKPQVITGAPAPAPLSVEVKIPSAEPDSGLWTSKDVAQHLRVSLKTVFNLRKKGLPFVQLGGAVRFDPQEIKDYLIQSRRLSSHQLRQLARQGGGG